MKQNLVYAEPERLLAGYTFKNNIKRAVAFILVLKNQFEVRRSVLIFHTKFKVKELMSKQVNRLKSLPLVFSLISNNAYLCHAKTCFLFIETKFGLF